MSSLYVKTVVAALSEPRTLDELAGITQYSRKLVLTTIWEARMLGIDIQAVHHPLTTTTFELKGVTR